MERKNLNKLIEEALAIEAEEAKEANALGYMARALTQATIPHSKQKEVVFERQNGSFNLAIMAHLKVGLPYGSIPRLLISYLTTEAVKTRSRNIELGRSLSEFMRELDLVPTGGRWGSITRLKDQMKRLFSSSIACSYTNEKVLSGINFAIVDQYDLWWDVKKPDQLSLFESQVKLGERFFNEVIENPVPIDLRVLKALKKSPMALDIYCWMTYRMSYLKKKTEIPWAALQAQFGANYALDSQGTRNFKRAFLKQLNHVYGLYHGFMIHQSDRGLTLNPGKSHVAKVCKIIEEEVV